MESAPQTPWSQLSGMRMPGSPALSQAPSLAARSQLHDLEGEDQLQLSSSASFSPSGLSMTEMEVLREKNSGQKGFCMTCCQFARSVDRFSRDGLVLAWSKKGKSASGIRDVEEGQECSRCAVPCLEMARLRLLAFLEHFEQMVLEVGILNALPSSVCFALTQYSQVQIPFQSLE